jgi:hypothetical protein
MLFLLKTLKGAKKIPVFYWVFGTIIVLVGVVVYLFIKLRHVTASLYLEQKNRASYFKYRLMSRKAKSNYSRVARKMKAEYNASKGKHESSRLEIKEASRRGNEDLSDLVNGFFSGRGSG